MTEQTTMTSRESILERIAESYEKLGGGGDAADFVGRFYRHVATDELRSRSAATLAGVAAAHRELAEVRQPGTANVRVFNPTTDDDGWSSARTVVQIVTDDMPFLVDSVTNAIVGQDLDIHLLVHPQLVVSRDAAGRLQSVEHAEPGQGVRVDAVGRINESWMLLTIDRETDEQTLADLETTIRGVLTDVRESVEDWPKMRTRCLVIAAELEGTPPVGLDADEVRRNRADGILISEFPVTLDLRRYSRGRHPVVGAEEAE